MQNIIKMIKKKITKIDKKNNNGDTVNKNYFKYFLFFGNKKKS